jgi:hypothetical protein
MRRKKFKRNAKRAQNRVYSIIFKTTRWKHSKLKCCRVVAAAAVKLLSEKRDKIITLQWQ